MILLTICMIAWLSHIVGMRSTWRKPSFQINDFSHINSHTVWVIAWYIGMWDNILLFTPSSHEVLIDIRTISSSRTSAKSISSIFRESIITKMTVSHIQQSLPRPSLTYTSKYIKQLSNVSLWAGVWTNWSLIPHKWY